MFWQAIVLSAALEAGFVSGGVYNYSQSNNWINVGALYTSLEATVEYGHLYVGGGMDCYFVPLSLTNYMPFQMTYTLDAGLKFGDFQIGYEHSCYHPTQVYATIMGNEIKPKYEGGYNRFFIRFSK